MTVTRTMRVGRPKGKYTNRAKLQKIYYPDENYKRKYLWVCLSCGCMHHTKYKPIRCSNRKTCGRMFE